MATLSTTVVAQGEVYSTASISREEAVRLLSERKVRKLEREAKAGTVIDGWDMFIADYRQGNLIVTADARCGPCTFVVTMRWQSSAARKAAADKAVA